MCDQSMLSNWIKLCIYIFTGIACKIPVSEQEPLAWAHWLPSLVGNCGFGDTKVKWRAQDFSVSLTGSSKGSPQLSQTLDERAYGIWAGGQESFSLGLTMERLGDKCFLLYLESGEREPPSAWCIVPTCGSWPPVARSGQGELRVILGLREVDIS